MIHFKRMKQQILAEFETVTVQIEIEVQTKRINNELDGHYLNIPWGLGRGGAVTIRWNIKRNCFDKITFKAFGKLHRIKL